MAALRADRQDEVPIDNRFVIAPDPRVKLAADAYAQQFAFAKKVEAANARLAQAKSESDALDKQLKDARKGADAGLLGALDAFDAKLATITGVVQTPNPANARAYPPKSTITFALVDEALGKLAAAADGADAVPTADARAGYEQMMPMVERVIAVWERFKVEDMAALNAALKAAGKVTLDP